MNVTTIIDSVWRRVKSAAWYRAERIALAILARSGRHVTGDTRLAHVLYAVKHSEAYKRGAVVTTPRAWVASSERN